MWKRGTNHIDNRKLGQLEEELFRAFDASDAEINAAATSPFLYRRIRVRIEAEERRKLEERSRWFALLTTARHAIPALALIAILAAAVSWYVPFPGFSNQTSDLSSVESSLTYPSREDVMASLVDWQENGSNGSGAPASPQGTKGAKGIR